MDVIRLIEALRRPETYPHPVAGVEIIQTHISVVALAGPHAYKFKKPLDLGFLDFTTLAKRRHYCSEEVRLNRRLAPEVYLGLVPLATSGGRLVLEGSGAPVEYAVKMQRLPDEATLLRRLGRGELNAEVFAELGKRVASFHAAAESGPGIDRCGAWAVVAGNARENLHQSVAQVGETLSEPVFARLTDQLDERLLELQPVIEARAREHVPRDTHGDLHLDHVYLFPERAPPQDLVVIDCIEFNERYRYADPVADMAFLAMDLLFRGRRDLADSFVEAYFDAADDPVGPELLSFYVAYRAAVRGKVEGIVAGEREVPEHERLDAARRARGHWLLALSELEDADRRPSLVLVGGLPGTGKSTIAELLAREAGFVVVSSDQVRKELAGLSPKQPAPSAWRERLYTSEWNDRTYAACLDRACDVLFRGGRVIVDASFREARRRQAFLEAALEWGVRTVLIICTASAETAKRRILGRPPGASDADWGVREAAADEWEAVDWDMPGRSTLELSTEGPPEGALGEAMVLLRSAGLKGPQRQPSHGMGVIREPG